VLVLLAAALVPVGGAQQHGADLEGRLSDCRLKTLEAPEGDPWEVSLPERNRREAVVGGDVFGGRLRLSVKLGRNPLGAAVRLSVYAVNKNGWFYKSTRDFLLTHRRYRDVVIDLAPDSRDLMPAGSARPWGEMAGVALRRVGLALFAERGTYDGPVIVREARVAGGSRSPEIRMSEPALEGLEVTPEDPGAGELVEMGFSFPVAFANPFDPEYADLQAKITAPNGEVRSAPAFFDQEFVPVQEGFEVRPVPVGPGRWKVRFLARKPGKHKVAFLWNRKKFGDVIIQVGRPEGRHGGKGAVRRDSSYLERLTTVGGESFLRRMPIDPGRGFSVWDGGAFKVAPGRSAYSSGWVAPLEWTAEWGSWLGLGKYSLEVAWKLDIALARAERIGVRRPLLLNFDGMFARGGRHPLDHPRFYGGSYLQSGRYRWGFNPLSAGLGGPLAGPGEYFRSEKAEKVSRALFRYLAARYGEHPAVDGLVFAASFPAEGVPGWHDRVGRYLARCFNADGRAGLRLSSYHPQAVAMGNSRKIGSFEAGSQKGWRLDRTACPGAKGAYSTAVKSQGRRSLRIDGDFPGEVFCLLREIESNCASFEQISFDAYLPEQTPRGLHVRVQAILRDRELNWYEALLPGELRRGDWTKMVLDLRPGRSSLTGVPADPGEPDLRREWDDYSRQRIRVVGLRFFAWSETAGATGEGGGRRHESSGEGYASSGAEVSPAGRGPAGTRPAAPGGRPRTVYHGPIYIDNVKLAGQPAGGRPRRPLAFSDFASENTESPRTFEKVEYSFQLNRAFENPFDPDCVEVRAQVLNRAVGIVKYVPGFFYQGYRRRAAKTVTVIDYHHKKRSVEVPEGAEQLLPRGGSWWKVRLAASEPGEHLVNIQVLLPDRRGGKKVVLQKKGLRFTASRGARKGYVRLAGDGRHFEHSGGEFFYPLGMAIRSPSDARDLGRDPEIRRRIHGEKPVLLPYAGRRPEYLDLIHARGTFQFDEYLEKSGAAGANWARVWMCPWWLGLEWDHRYPGYEGAGRYNLANAWRMDHVLEQAEKSNIYLQVCLTNHGQVCSRIDREWDFHPYRKKMPSKLYKAPDRPSSEPISEQKDRPGGFLDYPRDWFIDKRARRLTRNRLRYVVARWGYSPYIMGFALMSEVEFTGGTEFRGERNWDGRRMPLQTAWHKEMAEYIRTIDPYRHLVTTHFSHPQNGTDVWNTRSLDYVQSNAYSSFSMLQDEFGQRGRGRPNGTIGAPAAMRDYYRRYMSRWRRPVVVGEWGGHWMSNSKDVLDSELHTGLWAQACTPMAGATGYWWWLHVHFNDRYAEFSALARFVKGEDFRGITRSLTCSAKIGEGQGAKAAPMVMAAGDGANRAYAYVYSRDLLRSLESKTEYADGTVRVSIGGLAADTYTVEFWNTWTGKPTRRTRKVTTSGGPLEFALPEFRGDLAMKIAGARKIQPRPEVHGRTPKSGSRGTRAVRGRR